MANYIINSVDKTKLSCNTPYRRSTTVSLETCPLYFLLRLTNFLHYARAMCENGGLFLRLGLPVHTNPSRNGALGKLSSNRRNLKTPALPFFVWTESILKIKFFKNVGITIKSCDFLARVFLKHKSKMTGDCCVFKFIRRSVEGKHFMRFQSETSVF